VASVVEGRRILELTARTKAARAWLEAHPGVFEGRRIDRVRSRGKHLVGWIDGGFYFHSHLMMWGRWELRHGPAPVERDRRERARIVTDEGAAILMSAPVFEIGEGDPFEQVERLASLGPDVLPYPDEPSFDADEFLRRLRTPTTARREIGAVLLDQRIVAGIGNYLRAEILFECRIDPWKRVHNLDSEALDTLVERIPAVARRAYEHEGATAGDVARERMRADASLVYAPGREYGTRHLVFRRTNLPCLECGDVVRQLRQRTSEDEDGEKTRITYFCPTCQRVETRRDSRKAG